MNTAVIIGGGPSLTKGDIDYCRGRCSVYGVNDAYRLAPWIDVLYAADYRWWRWHVEKVKSVCPGELWTTDERAAKEFDLNWIKSVLQPGFSHDASMIHRGHNSGYQAMNLAVIHGFDRLLLLGFDMKSSDKGQHWFGEHPDSMRCSIPFHLMIPAFERISGVEIVNCSSDSALTCFPKADIRSAL